MNPDLAFVAKAWERQEVPKDKRYLLHYFSTPVQEAFLRYYLIFGNYDCFVEHTGHYCQVRWLKLLEEKYHHFESLRAKARAEMDLTLLSRLEHGQFIMSKQK